MGEQRVERRRDRERERRGRERLVIVGLVGVLVGCRGKSAEVEHDQRRRRVAAVCVVGAVGVAEVELKGEIVFELVVIGWLR